MHRLSGRALLLALAATCCCLPSVAVAQARATVVRELQATAASDDDAASQVAIDQLAKLRSPAATQALAALLLDGPTDARASVLLHALGQAGDSTALEAIRACLRHPVPALRASAIRALGLHAQRATLHQEAAQGLRDLDPLVRAAAVETLVSMKATDTVPVLHLAFERGVSEAAAAIGTLGDEAALQAFNALLGHKPIGDMLAGYRAFLLRADLHEPVKLGIVALLEETAGVTVKRFLQALIDTGALGRDAAVRRAVSTTISRIREPEATP